MNAKKEFSVCINKSNYKNLDIDLLTKPLGGIKNFINNGDSVLLKTNLLNATEPNKAVVTNPLFLKAVAHAVTNAGGIPIIGDSPSGQFTKRRLEKVYNKAGLVDLSNKEGIKLNYDTRSKKVIIPNGKKLKSTSICNFVLDADKIISVPKLKTHSFMIMSLGTKIMYGAVPGLKKVRYHSTYFRRKVFAEMLLDILSVVPPNLIIMDGIIAMQGEGPMSGDPIELGVILASTDSIALDLAVCKMLDIEPTGIPTLKQAKIRKLWPQEINYPLLSPEDIIYKNFVLPSTAGHLLMDKNKPKKYPVINENCTACKECVQICPRKAIKIKENQAKVDYSKCIRCYCCHEVCTYNAIKIDLI